MQYIVVAESDEEVIIPKYKAWGLFTWIRANDVINQVNRAGFNNAEIVPVDEWMA